MSAALDWIGAAGLPARWRGLARLVVLDASEAGDGGSADADARVGHRAIVDAWRQAWRADADRCAELHVIVVDAAAQALTPNLHRLSFDEGAFVALVVPMALEDALPELVARVDLFHVAASPRNESPIDSRAWKAFGRLAADGAMLVLDDPADPMRAALVTAGFRFREAAMNRRAVATFEPRDLRARQRLSNHPSPPSHAAATATSRRAIVIGAGLAGCATAWALAERGWHSTVIDAQDRIAADASGNPAGLFHGIFNRQDGRHARFNRAASLEAAKAVRVAIDDHGAQGAVDGVIRIEGADAHVGEMQASIAALGLPRDYVEALDARGVSETAGLDSKRAGWFYRSGGWVDPAALARSFIERARGRTELRLGRSVLRLRRAGSSWQLVDRAGNVIDEAETVVLANAHDALRLLNTATGDGPGARIDWPLTRVRGQVSVMPAGACPDGSWPRLPLTGSGYVIPIGGGRVMFGSTAQPDDDDGSVRLTDHLANLARLAPWIDGAGGIDAVRLEGRTAWRCVAADRMPVIGAVPLLRLGASGTAGEEVEPTGTIRRLDQPRLVPREPGLYVHTALGSRGITWAALGAESLAAVITGAPCPIEASLLDAIDPARFVSRRVRRRG